MIGKLVAAAPIALFAAPIAMAAPDSSVCEYDTLLPEGRARVVGSDRAYFEHDAVFCRDDRNNCTRRSYLIAGDVAMIGPSQGGFTCVNYFAGSKLVTGWIRSERLERQRDPAPTLRDWEGHWSNGPWAMIDLTRSRDRLVVGGNALWQSRDTHGQPIPGGVNTGDLSGEVKPVGESLHLSDEDEFCVVDMKLISGSLFVRDNRQCGGLNVTFTGAYHRKRGHR